MERASPVVPSWPGNVSHGASQPDSCAMLLQRARIWREILILAMMFLPALAAILGGLYSIVFQRHAFVFIWQ